MLSLAQQPGWSAVGLTLFSIFAALACLGAVMVVATRNIVRMAVYLLLTLGGVAGLYFLMDAEFLAAIQLIVYAGGILVLIVFGVMLTGRSLWDRLTTSPVELIAGLLVGLVTMVSLVAVVWTTPWPQRPLPEDLPQGAAIEGLAVQMLNGYLIPFEAAAVLLLVVMIGAAYLAKTRRRTPDEV